jgi:uncharacterized protein YkwD
MENHRRRIVQIGKICLMLALLVLFSFESIDPTLANTDTPIRQPQAGGNSVQQHTRLDQQKFGPDDSPAALSPRWQSGSIDTTSGAEYLTAAECAMIIEINMVRTDPAAYASNFLKPLRAYYRGRLLQYPGEIAIQTNEGIRALDECIRALEKSSPLSPLVPKKGLTLAARDHAKDQARTGQTGHTGSDGSSFSTRMNRYGKWNTYVGENIGYGNSQTRRIVISLLIDDGVTSRGHRRNLLDRSFNYIGTAVGPHKAYRSMCVIDLAGSYD